MARLLLPFLLRHLPLLSHFLVVVVIVLATAATLVVALTTTFSTVISSLVAVLLRTLILLMMLLLVMVLLGLAMLVGRLLNRAMTVILLMIMLISLFVVIAHEPWLHLLRIMIDLAGWAFLLRCISHLLLLIASAFGSEVDEVTASLPARLLLLRLTLLRVLGLGLLLVPEWLWLIFVCERLFS